jgi:DNA primase
MANRSYQEVVKDVQRQCVVKKILDYYEIKYQVRTGKHGEEYVTNCIFHETLRGKPDTHPSLSINSDKKLYNCWSCPAKGNIFQFVMQCELLYSEKKSCSFHEALLKICEICNIEVDGLFKLDKNKFNEDLDVEEINTDDLLYTSEVFNEEVLKKFYLKTHTYFINRGYKPETLKYFEMGFGVKGTDKDRCIFPVRNITGGLVGWSGRAVKKNMKPKWLHQPDDRFYTSLNLFNIDKALPYIIKTGKVYVVESIGNCMRMYEAGFKNTVALLGSKMSNVQAEMLLEYADEIYLLLDPDEAGYDGTQIAIDRLYGKGSKIFIGIYNFGIDSETKKAKDIGDATVEMVLSIVYQSVDEYIESNRGVIDMLNTSEKPAIVELADGVKVMCTEELVEDCEYPQVTKTDMKYLNLVDKLFNGIADLSIVSY